MRLPVAQPTFSASRGTVMIKPVGALCNLDCTYCYYLPTKTIYDGHEHRMRLETLESVFASILPRFTDEVTIAWQGGEPTLAGLKFFEKAIEFQNKYKRPDQKISHALQTNGTLIDDAWCKFLRENDFLIGLSVDGPPHLHDPYRISNRGEPSSKSVLRGHKTLQRNAVEYNILCVLNDMNVHRPEEIFQYLLNLGSRWVQFIPAVEWVPDPERPGQNILAPYSPDPEAYGDFLCTVFDLWFERYRKRVSVRIFDAVLNKLVLGQMPFCILDGSCHNQLTIEHDGSVFGCDHFVERRWQLAHIGDTGWQNEIDLDGNLRVGLTIHGGDYEKTDSGRDIHQIDDLDRYGDGKPSTQNGGKVEGVDEPWYDRVDDDRLATFAARKQNLAEGCKTCEYKTYCYGGCPKHRSQGGDVPEPTVLCPSYKKFYAHSLERFEFLASYLRRGYAPPDPQPVRRKTKKKDKAAAGEPAAGPAPGGNPFAGVKRNDPCPCGSGLKFKTCHGNPQRVT